MLQDGYLQTFPSSLTPYPSLMSQGLAIFWNVHGAGFGGETTFVNGSGYGAGGYAFYNASGTPTASGVTGNIIGFSSDDITTPSAAIVSFSSGGTVTATSFNSTSDYRIKENVKELTDNYTVDQLKPKIYYNSKLKKTDIGFIAHEVEEVYPFLVEGEKDGCSSIQSLNYQGLIGILVKEVQNLKKRVAELENINIKI